MSIHKREGRRNPWRVMFRDATGTQRSQSFATHRAAVHFDSTMRRVEQSERVTNERPDSLTFAAWLDTWFELYSRQWKRRTVGQRGSVCEKWLKPYLGAVPVAAIKMRTILEWREQVLADGASNNTVNAAKRVLSSALTAAVKNEVLERNYCGDVAMLPHRRKVIRPLTPDEVENVRELLPTDRDRIIVSFMAYAGMRPAEVCALTYGDCRNGLILIEDTVQLGELDDTKTMRPRTVEILPALADDLAEYGRGADDEYIVNGTRGGFLNWNIWGSRTWRKYVPAPGPRAYDLRHTFASLALHEGRSLPWIQDAMGHASSETLLDNYAHVYHESRLATHVPMNDAIRDARTVEAKSRRQEARKKAAASA